MGKPLDREIARARLLKDHYELRPGSYFHWIEKEWWPRFKPLLVRTYDGRYIPTLEKLSLLQAVDKAYREWSWKQFGSEMKNNEYVDSLSGSTKDLTLNKNAFAKNFDF